jgi:N-acetylglutamate synthase-like GNAT family acetyltransferase
MALSWIHETSPHWDPNKSRIIGAAGSGVFDLGPFAERELIPGEWWRVEDNSKVVGYGWMDTTWGDAEILLAVDPAQQHRGVGTFILDRLEQEAAARGLNYLYNVVRPTHPHRSRITRWLQERRFQPADDDRLMRRVEGPVQGTT